MTPLEQEATTHGAPQRRLASEAGVALAATTGGTVVGALILKLSATQALLYIAAPLVAIAAVATLAMRLRELQSKLRATRRDLVAALDELSQQDAQISALRTERDQKAAEAEKQRDLASRLLDVEVFARSECVDLCYEVAALALAPEGERPTRLATMETMFVDACLNCCKPARAVVFYYDAEHETLWPGQARGWQGGATLPELSTRTSGKQMLDDVLKADTTKRCHDVLTEPDPTVLALAFDKNSYPSYALLPIRTREVLIGVLLVESSRPRGVDTLAVTRLRVAACLYACAAALTPNHRRSRPRHAE